MTYNWNFQSPICKGVRLGAAALVAIALATPARAFDPAAGDFDKPTVGPPLVRVLIWNVHNNFIYTADDDGRYSRVIKAIKPDVVAFQEMDHSLTAAQVTGRMSSYFPGTTWYAHLGKADGSNT